MRYGFIGDEYSTLGTICRNIKSMSKYQELDFEGVILISKLFQWVGRDPQIIEVDGTDKFFVKASKGDESKATFFEKESSRSWPSFSSYVTSKHSWHTITRSEFGFSCSCWQGAKKLICKHIVGIKSIYFGFSFPQASRIITKRSKSGRPKKFRRVALQKL